MSRTTSATALVAALLLRRCRPAPIVVLDWNTIMLDAPAVPGVTLHYKNLRDISDDIDDARLFGGIHFRFDEATGNEQSPGWQLHLQEQTPQDPRHRLR